MAEEHDWKVLTRGHHLSSTSSGEAGSGRRGSGRRGGGGEGGRRKEKTEGKVGVPQPPKKAEDKVGTSIPPSNEETSSNESKYLFRKRKMVQAGGVNGGGGGRDGDRFAVNSPLETNPFTLAPHDVIEAAAEAICDELLDDAILNITFEIHRSMKRGLLMLEAGIPEDDSRFYQVNAEGLDVFGQAPVKKQHECVCPNCSRNLAASRFAPHLEKCMGMGRNSSRIASRRIQNSTRENNSHAMVGQGSDDDDDDDWYVDRKRRKRDKNSPRRSRTPKICGVVSEHTGKMCTRSMRCPQHSMEQRRAVRDQLLGMSDMGVNMNPSTTTTRAADSTTTSLSSKYSILDSEDAQVGESDIMETEACQLSSGWDHDLSNTTSPADSTSTNNSSSTATTSSSSSSSSNKKLSSSSGKSKKKNGKNSRSSKENHHHSNLIID